MSALIHGRLAADVQQLLMDADARLCDLLMQQPDDKTLFDLIANVRELAEDVRAYDPI